MTVTDIDQAIARIQQALDAGEIGVEGLYSPTQINYMAAWTECYRRAPLEFRNLMEQVMDEQPAPQLIRSVNTMNPHQIALFTWCFTVLIST